MLGPNEQAPGVNSRMMRLAQIRRHHREPDQLPYHITKAVAIMMVYARFPRGLLSKFSEVFDIEYPLPILNSTVLQRVVVR